MAEIEPSNNKEDAKHSHHELHHLPLDQQTQGSNNFTSGQSTAAETYRNEIQPRKFKKFDNEFFFPEKT